MPISCGNMDSYKDVFYATGLPALISTGITLVYLLLKTYQFTVYAISHKAEGRLAAATKGGRQREHGSIAGEEGDPQVHEQVPGSFSNRYGAGIQKPCGPISLSRKRKDICIAARRNAEEYSGESSVQENGKRLQGRGNRSTKNIDGQESRGPHDDSSGVMQKVAAGQMPKMNNHDMMVELAAKNDQTKILMMEFWDLESPKNK